MDEPDQIHLRDYLVETEIGAFQSERGLRQRLRFGVTVDLAQPVSDAATSPTTTPTEVQTSVIKCRASPSSAMER